LAQFSRQIQDFCLLFLGGIEQSVQLTVGTYFEVHGGSYSSMDLARITRHILGLFECVVSGLFLAGNCDFDAVMYFPEAE
jgi:hypothetical protein